MIEKIKTASKIIHVSFVLLNKRNISKNSKFEFVKKYFKIFNFYFLIIN
jgi:hypothetical protein